MEKTFAMIKPDGVQRSLVGNIIARYEAKGLRVAGMKIMQVTEAQAAQHYAEHVEKPFYPALEKYITSDVAYGMIVEGENAIDAIHDSNFMGSTRNPNPGTIRYEGFKLMNYLDRDPMINGRENVAHSSDSVEAAQKEIAIFISLLQKENTTRTDKEL